ncbi:MAG: hypothetical protein Q7R80_02210, partial [bacterium]|nr:hypothetical protein [bacterium]
TQRNIRGAGTGDIRMQRASDIWERIVRVAAYEQIAWGGIGPKFRFGGKLIQPERPWSGVVDLDNLDEDLAARLMGFFTRHRDSLVVQRLALHEIWRGGNRANVAPTELMAALLAGDRAADQREQVLVLVACDMDHPPDRELPARALRKAHERLGGDGKRFHVRLFDARAVRMISDLDNVVRRERIQADLPPEHRGMTFFATHQEALAAAIADLVGGRDDCALIRETQLVACIPDWADPEYIRLAEGRPWTHVPQAPLSERYARWVARPGDEAAIEILAMHAGARVLASPETPIDASALDPVFGDMLASIDDMLMPDEFMRIWRTFCGT